MRRIMFVVLACACLDACGSDTELANLIDDAPAPSGALAAVPMLPAAHATDHGWTVHGLEVTRDDLAKWAPIVTFHFQERYLPSSIDHLLHNAALVDAEGHVLVQGPSQTDLQREPQPGNRVILHPDSYAGDALDAQHRVQAPMYVSAQVPEDASFVDLNYIFLSGFNGSQTARLNLFGVSTELTLPHFADHQGDIESISVRVTPDFQRVIFVRFEGHGHSHFTKPEDAQFIGTHVAVLSALNSHANYNAKAYPRHHQHVEARISALGFGIDVLDITDATGPTWAPFAVDAQGQTHDVGALRFVGIDDHQQVLGDQTWAAFAGRIGDFWDNTFVGVLRPDGTLPNIAVRGSANGLISAAIGLGKTRAFVHAAGSVGLAERGTVLVTSPLWNPPAHF